jgi:hypothetical protein
MSEHIDRLCGKLRIKLHGIDRRLQALEGNTMAPSGKSQHAVESHLDRIEQLIYDNRIIVGAANARVKAWLDGNEEDHHRWTLTQAEYRRGEGGSSCWRKVPRLLPNLSFWETVPAADTARILTLQW